MAPPDFVQAVRTSDSAFTAQKVIVGSGSTLNQETSSGTEIVGGIGDAGAFQRQFRTWRDSNRLTQRQLAEQLGYDVAYIAKLEKGTKRPSRAFLARWSQLAGQSEESLLHVSMSTDTAVAGGTGHAGAFQRQLRSWRHSNRLTQQQLAEQLGYDVTYIYKLEGGTRPPSRAFLARWSQFTGQSEQILLHLPTGDISRPSLPQRPTPLIGREDALGALLDLLVGPCRCVTLIGPPGIGKTRLATEAALRVDGSFADGVLWVPLLDVTDAEGVWQSLLRALGISDRTRSDSAEPVLERLRGQKALVVFDHFEHVIASRQVVSRLVEGSQATVLITSRESLDIVSEHVFAVIPLVVPDPATNPTYEEVRGSSAVALFVARATMAQPDFRLTPSNYAAVLAACALCDGIPLAIALAAGGLRTVDLAGLVERL